jgi:phosphoribosylglycinamide formyltransferase 1
MTAIRKTLSNKPPTIKIPKSVIRHISRPRTINHEQSTAGPVHIAIMVSGQGRGSNMQAIIDGCKSGKINGEVALVLGVKDDAPAIERARGQGIPTLSISPKAYETTEAYDTAVFDALKAAKIDLICLAGYMRVLGQNVVDRWRDRIMNVHPALIPSFCGKGMYGHHVHEAVIARGVKFTGVTVHLVDEEYDTGPIVLQTVVPVSEDDTPDTIAAKVLVEEHRTYTDAIALFAAGRLRVVGRKVRILAE